MHQELKPTDIVMGFGILAIGLVGVSYVFLRTKSMLWFSFANTSFWFFLYGIVFDVSRWHQGIMPSLYDVGYSIAGFVATVVFAVFSYRYRRAR